MERYVFTYKWEFPIFEEKGRYGHLVYIEDRTYYLGYGVRTQFLSFYRDTLVLRSATPTRDVIGQTTAKT